MSERLKEPVLKTGDVRASVGSNPTLSAILFIIYIMRKYPSGRRGSPAKGVDVQTTCEGSNPSFRASSEKALKAMEKAFRAFSIRRTGFFFAFKHDPQFVRPDGERSWRLGRQHLLGSRLRNGVRDGSGFRFVNCPSCGKEMEPGEGALPPAETERGRVPAGG